MIIILIVYIINLIAIFSLIFLEHKSPEETLIWIFVLILFPIVGILLYLSLCSTINIKNTYLKHDKVITSFYNDYLNNLNIDLPSRYSSDTYKSMIDFNSNYSKSILTTHNKITQILSGKEKYERLFKDIENAKKSINIQYFSIQNDIIGKSLIDLLTKMSSKGVKINILYDAYGSITTSNSLFKELIKSGANVKKIKPYFTHYRNHRKIVVIDSEIAYIGGMNIGKKYANLSKNKKPWRDTQIRIVGDCVNIIQYYFLYDWFCASKYKEFDIANDNLSFYFKDNNIDDILPCQVVIGGVDTDKEYISMSYLKMISSAKNKLYIQSPYFIPNKSILDAIKVALSSGVDVQIMLPQIKPNIFLQHAGDYYINELIEYGAKIYKYKGYIHSKTISIDNLVTCIGSVNIDVRSLLINHEICAFIYDEKFTKDYEEIFNNDKLNCIELDYNKFRNRSLYKKVCEKFFNLFSFLM